MNTGRSHMRLTRTCRSLSWRNAMKPTIRTPAISMRKIATCEAGMGIGMTIGCLLHERVVRANFYEYRERPYLIYAHRCAHLSLAYPIDWPLCCDCGITSDQILAPPGQINTNQLKLLLRASNGDALININQHIERREPCPRQRGSRGWLSIPPRSVMSSAKKADWSIAAMTLGSLRERPATKRSA